MLSFKIADNEREFREIHRLNYETFVEEIPQHRKNPDRSLVDKYHEENSYIICLNKDRVAGMIAVRDKRPFSLDVKLKNLDDYLPRSRTICEIRLLSIKKEYRKRKLIQGLFKFLAEYCEEKNYDLAIISATTNQERLYKTLGFQPFGPLVGTNGARYQPMYLTTNSYINFKNSTKLLNGTRRHSVKTKKFLFQPGPVAINKEVEFEFNKPPVSHRSAGFNELYKETRSNLCEITSSKFSQIMMGSGTLSNDLVAAHLSLLGEKGLILTNGEFGDRLVNQAERFKLDFDTVTADWGTAIDYEAVKKKVTEGNYSWLWFVHCETSTGILNSIENLRDICAGNNIKLCVDCISTIGNINLDLSDAYLATGASGKGLASYPGLSFVFSNHAVRPDKNLPWYLDIGTYAYTEGVPFTLSSNLLSALRKSLELLDISTNLELAKVCSDKARKSLKELGISVINEEPYSLPSVVTFKLPDCVDSLQLGQELEKQNIYLSYRSSYLTERNQMQFAFMGEYCLDGLEYSLSGIKDLIKK